MNIRPLTTQGGDGSFRARRARQVLQLADKRGLSIASAESCTGGQLAALLTNVEGLAHRFECAFVPYSDESKCRLLDVPADLIEAEGAVSKAVARSMAEGALERSNAAIAVSVTGYAGPGAPGEEPGLVHLACADRRGRVWHREEHFNTDDRDLTRDFSVNVALLMLEEALSV